VDCSVHIMFMERALRRLGTLASSRCASICCETVEFGIGMFPTTR
jgi:hypothetical protein